MNNKQAFFGVDPKLTKLLGENYRSVELAVKELVDNAYDADANKVEITLPEPLEPDPRITIKDDGSGMKEGEVRNEYLKIANGRVSRKGDRSIQKNRKVKGRKGIGKFAGLMVAQLMTLETRSSGQWTKVVMDKQLLSEMKEDLEKVALPVEVAEIDKRLQGTTVILEGISQNLHFPNEEKLRSILVRDYGREDDFRIYINGVECGVNHLNGESFSFPLELDGIEAQLDFSITAKPVTGWGVALRVGNKIIGKPMNLLDKNDLIPLKLQKRVYGELICDELESDVTADLGAIIEGSRLLEKLKSAAEKHVEGALKEVFGNEMNLAKARYQKKINKELERLPQFKRKFAKIQLERVLEKFYGEKDDKIQTIINLMIEAMEHDAYWIVVKSIENARRGDVQNIAEALDEFGLLELSMMSNRINARMKFLDVFQEMIEDNSTLEKDIHKAIEKNLWILGEEYHMMFSETTLSNTLANIIEKKQGDNKRIDMLVGQRRDGNLLLIEFKRPSFTLTRDTERQAQEYVDRLRDHYNANFKIILLGGKVNTNVKRDDIRENTVYATYNEVILDARSKFQSLLDNLSH